MKYFTVLLLLLMGLSVGKAQNGFRNLVNEKALDYTELKGIWSYEVAGLDHRYSRGLLIIDKTEGNYDLLVKLLNGGSLTAYDLLVAGNKLQFHVNPDGVERVAVILTMEGDAFEGEVFAKEANYAVKGIRKLPEK